MNGGGGAGRGVHQSRLFVQGTRGPIQLRNAPRKQPFFKHISLHTDIEELNQVLKSPKGAVSQPVIPAQLDPELTKKYVVSLLRRYEPEVDAEKQWEGFMTSVA